LVNLYIENIMAHISIDPQAALYTGGLSSAAALRPCTKLWPPDRPASEWNGIDRLIDPMCGSGICSAKL
jgi:hypothetical protein